MNQKADINEIKRGISVLFQPGDTIELRVLKVGGRQTHAGYFRDFDKLAAEAARLSGQAGGVYVVLNQINPALYARAADRIAISPENLTQDKDIVRRRWLPIDVDARRPAGISSSHTEHETAIKTAYLIRDFLTTFGFSLASIILGDSGNGAHVLGKVDLQNNTESENTVKACLKAVAVRFDSEAISIDQTVYNAARIWKLPGTLAAKGDNIPERPHRIARLLEVSA